MKLNFGIFIIALGVFFIVHSTSAFATETYECKYTSFSDEKGNHAEVFNLKFLLDETSGEAFAVGNNGTGEVRYISNFFGVSFIEVTDSGNVMTTSINSDMNSVHSRHFMDAQGILPAQYYGSCIKK